MQSETRRRTRPERGIPEIYDQLAEVICTGRPYQTCLDPPTDREGNFLPMAQWDKNNWPPHIHAKKTEAHT